MRIAHVTDCYLPRLGGIELNVHDLAQHQATAGHDVMVITSTAGPDPDMSLAPGSVIRVAGAASQPGRIEYHHSWAGRRLLGPQTVDVVHVHASSFSPLSFVTAHHTARRGVPTVATVHSLWAKATPLFQIANRLTGWAEWPVEWSAVSDAAAVALRRVVAEQAAVTVLPNGIDPESWKVNPVAADPNQLRVAVVGRLAARKRTLHLARVLRAAARHRVPSKTLLSVEIIGDGPERRPLEKYLRHHGMTDWVHLRGRLDRQEIRSVFGRSDLFVAPALLESFGIAALEARCSGLPILARARTGTQDFVTHEREGWLADSDTAMVDIIVSLVADRDRLDRVSKHNRSVAPAITWPFVLDRCETLYQRALHRSRPGALRPPPGLTGMDVAAR